LTEVWGVVKPAGGDQDQAKQEWRKRLSPEALQGADLSRGRASFQKVCASCHRLYGEGGIVGPDLTGSGRTQLDYLVEHIVDPNSVVPADYRVAVATLKDGRVLNGVLKSRTERTITLVGQSEETTVERADIESLEQPEQSMMPEGLLDSLSLAEARDLIAYLMSPRQVPLPQ
jgi:putative heme-binding domain-containing protein